MFSFSGYKTLIIISLIMSRQNIIQNMDMDLDMKDNKKIILNPNSWQWIGRVYTSYNVKQMWFLVKFDITVLLCMLYNTYLYILVLSFLYFTWSQRRIILFYHNHNFPMPWLYFRYACHDKGIKDIQFNVAIIHY